MGDRTFNTILRDLRTRRGLTQDELAADLHITKQALSHYERGTRYPKKEMLESIADYFNVDMNYLTGRSTTTTTIQREPEADPQAPAYSLTDEELLIAMAYSRADTTTKNGVRALLELPFIPVDKEIEEEELPRLKAPDEYKTYYPIVDPNTGETRQIEIVTELDKLKHRNLVRLAEIGVIPKHPRVKRLRDIRKKEKV